MDTRGSSHSARPLPRSRLPVLLLGLELCPELGIAIPVGKDSLSMKTVWKAGGQDDCVAIFSET